MAGSTNISPVASLQASVNNNSTVTVPAGVTPQHLGIAVFVSANLYSTGTIPAMVGWSTRVSNPAVANNMEWTVMTRLGGHTAGDVITITQNKTTQFDLYMIWYDSTGLDINQIGTPSGRGTSNSQFTAITGLTATAAGQTAIVVATERSTAVGTNINSWSGTYTPGADNYGESSTNVFSSNFFGHFLINSSTSTGTITANYSTPSGNGAGVMFTLGTPQTSSLQDPFTTPNWQSSDVPQGSWFSELSDTAAPMGGGIWKLPFLQEYPYFYPWGQAFLFNLSTMTVEVRMDAVGTESFSMRLTSDGMPEKGNSFISMGITTGGKLYMNQRVYDPATSPPDDLFVSNIVVQANQPIVLRLRHGGGSTVYADYSWDYVNWINFASKTAKCFNPVTDLIIPMFQTGTTGTVDEWTVFANISQMNTGKFSAYNAPWRGTTQWSYWDGTKEVELPPESGWAHEVPSAYIGPKVVGTATNAEISTGTTVTCPVPAGVQAGEWLVAAVAQTGTYMTNVPTPTGWRDMNLGENAASPFTNEIGMFSRVATSSEPASYAFPVNGGPASVQMVRVAKASGTDGGNTINPAGFGASAYLVGPNVNNTSLDNELLISAVAINSTSIDLIPPSGTTLISNTTGTGLRLAMTFEQRPTAGYVPAHTWTTAGGSSVSWVGMVANLISNDSQKPGTLVYPSQQGAVSQIANAAPRVFASQTTMPGTSIYPSADNEPYPSTTTYPGNSYPGATNYPGASDYPGTSSEIYPGG